MEKITIEWIPSVIASWKHDAIIKELSNYVSRVYLPLLDTQQIPNVIQAVERIHDKGMIPVPHIPARRLNTESITPFLEWLMKAQVSRILIIWGSQKTDASNFDSSLELLKSYKWREYGIWNIDIAAHPEWHISIDSSKLKWIVDEKLNFLSENNIAAAIMTQMTLATKSVNDWLSKTRGDYPDLPIHIWMWILPEWHFFERLKNQWKYIRLCELEKQATRIAIKQLRSSIASRNFSDFPFSQPQNVISLVDNYPDVQAHIYGFWWLKNILRFLEIIAHNK